MNKEQYLSLLRKQRELMAEYERLLEDASIEEMDHLINFPIFDRRRVYVERRCPLQKPDNGYMQLLTKPGERTPGLKELRDFTRESKSLIIVDPYFFSGKKESAGEIAKDLEKCTRAKQKHLERVHVVFDSYNETKAVRKSIEEMFKSNSVYMSVSSTGEIHDRVWVSDRERALVVGTSLNGIGNRAAFLLPLPENDLNELLDFLDEKSLSREGS